MLDSNGCVKRMSIGPPLLQASNCIFQIVNSHAYKLRMNLLGQNLAMCVCVNIALRGFLHNAAIARQEVARSGDYALLFFFE